MSLIITNTIGSARGYGYSSAIKRASGTLVFPRGISSWTAPAGVTNIISAIGQGGDGASDYLETNSYCGAVIVHSGDRWGDYGSTGFSNPPYLTASIFDAAATSMFDTITSRSSVGQYVWIGNVDWIVGTDNTWQNIYSTPSFFQSGSKKLVGSISYNRSYWGTGVPTSGNITAASISNWYAGGGFLADCNVEGYAGTATQGFGRSFPGGTYSGGTGYPASPTTINNIAVDPGTLYTIYNYGSLTITY
jgi:hypothetical protein